MAQCFVKEKFMPLFAAVNTPTLLYVCKVDGQSAQMPRAMHGHRDQAEIVLIRDGSGVYHINNRKYQTEKGDLLFYNSGVIHDEAANLGAGMSTYCIGVKNLQIKGLPENHFLAEAMCPVIHSGEFYERIHQLFAMLYFYVSSGEAGADEIGNHLMRALLVVLAEMIHGKAMPQETPEYTLGLRAKQYIDENYAEAINLSRIAAAVNANAYYLAHVFKDVVGYSPMQYVTRRRIGEAQNLLINTDYTITRIAMLLGYNNPNYFQIVFRTMVGTAPGKYRKSWIEKRK